jgi:hypothetical protein
MSADGEGVACGAGGVVDQTKSWWKYSVKERVNKKDTCAAGTHSQIKLVRSAKIKTMGKTDTNV